MNEASIIAIVGILGTAVGALIWIIKYLFDKILPSLDGLAKATDSNTRVTASADRYLRVRNGRDNEMHKELVKAVGDISTQIIRTADTAAKVLQETPVGQRIDKQEVKTQVVVKKVPELAE